MDVEGLVRYIYRGEVDVEPERLNTFLKTAEVLKIKGLADQNLATGMGGDASQTGGVGINEAVGVKKEVRYLK